MMTGLKLIGVLGKDTHSIRGNKLQYQCTDLLHEDEHGLSVLLPLIREVTLMRELITSQEYGQLKTVCVQVAEIIHT